MTELEKQIQEILNHAKILAEKERNDIEEYQGYNLSDIGFKCNGYDFNSEGVIVCAPCLINFEGVAQIMSWNSYGVSGTKIVYSGGGVALVQPSMEVIQEEYRKWQSA